MQINIFLTSILCGWFAFQGKFFVWIIIGGWDKRAVTELGFAHVTTKSWAYFGVFGFFRKKFRRKNCPPHPNHFLKIQWEIHFFTFLNTDQNAPKRKFRIEIWTFSFQICFKNQFSTSGSGPTENTQIRLTTSRSPKLIQKANLK